MRRDLYSHFYESTFLASVPLFRGLPADMQMELSMARPEQFPRPALCGAHS